MTNTMAAGQFRTGEPSRKVLLKRTQSERLFEVKAGPVNHRHRFEAGHAQVAEPIGQKGDFVADPHLLELLVASGPIDVRNALEDWRKRHPGVPPDLAGADLRRVSLRFADLSNARLLGADLSGLDLTGAILDGADSECHAYGISVWGMRGTPAKLSSFNIASTDWPQVRVDDLETAQLVHLFLESDKVRKLFENMGSKGVLVLGRFSEERKRLLDAICHKLRELGYLPLVFDFKKPSQYDFTETVRTLAGLSCFIIADITEPRSVPLELQATVPNYMIPFAPILREGEQPFAMFLDLQQKYRDWMLDLLTYRSDEELLEVLEVAVIAPALTLAAELRARKSVGVRTRRAQDVRQAP
jgi:hypothetical protein